MFSPLDTHDHAYQADAKNFAKEFIQNGDNVLPFDMGAIMGVSSHALSTSFPPGLQSMRLPDDIFSNYSSPMKVDGGFNFAYSSLCSPDIFARGLDLYSQQPGEALESRFEPESPGILRSANDPFKDSAELEKISEARVLLENCRSQQDFFGENLQYFDTDVSYLAQTLDIESQADFGSAVASFITRAHWSPYSVWGILLLVVKWKFSIKKKVARTKRTHQ